MGLSVSIVTVSTPTILDPDDSRSVLDRTLGPIQRDSEPKGKTVHRSFQGPRAKPPLKLLTPPPLPSLARALRPRRWRKTLQPLPRPQLSDVVSRDPAVGPGAEGNQPRPRDPTSQPPFTVQLALSLAPLDLVGGGGGGSLGALPSGTRVPRDKSLRLGPAECG